MHKPSEVEQLIQKQLDFIQMRYEKLFFIFQYNETFPLSAFLEDKLNPQNRNL